MGPILKRWLPAFFGALSAACGAWFLIQLGFFARSEPVKAPAVMPPAASASASAVRSPADDRPSAAIFLEDAKHEDRLSPIVEGEVTRLDTDQLPAAHALIDNPKADSALRNEVLSLLRQSDDPAILDQIERVINDPQQSERFRSFAVQHLGILWNATHSSAAAGPIAETTTRKSHRIQALLERLLDDSAVAVRREALLAACTGGSKTAWHRLDAWLADPAHESTHDLCIRLLSELRATDPGTAVRIRPFIENADERIAVAAFVALGELTDRESYVPLLHLLKAPGRRGEAARLAVARITAVHLPAAKLVEQRARVLAPLPPYQPTTQATP